MSTMGRRLLVGLLLGLLAASSLRAQPAPLQARIDAAAPGDTIYVEPGTHAGPLVVRVPLALIGREGARIDGQGRGHVIEVRASRVTVANLAIAGSGSELEEDHAGLLVTGHSVQVRNNRFRDVLHGIYVKGANRARLVGNDIVGKQSAAAGRALPPAQRGNGIHLWKSVGNVVANNTITGGRDGVYFSFADSTRARDNRIRGVRFGLHYMYSDHNTFEDNVFFGNAAGAALMYSSDLDVRANAFYDNRGHRGYGLLLQTVEDAQFTGNRLTQNTTGLYLENSSRNVFRRNRIAVNYRGVRLTGSSMDNVFAENTIQGNLQPVALAGTRGANTWHAGGIGNFWGRGRIVDLDGDGTSELPRHVLDLFAARREAFPYVGLLTASPGIEVLSHAMERLPPPGLPMITDPHPLVQAPSARPTRAMKDRRWRVALGSLLAILFLTGSAAQARRTKL